MAQPPTIYITPSIVTIVITMASHENLCRLHADFPIPGHDFRSILELLGSTDGIHGGLGCFHMEWDGF